MRNVDGIPLIINKCSFFKKAESCGILKSNILKFIGSTLRRLLKCYNGKGIRLMARLGLGLSHLLEHKFNRNFQNGIHRICSCGMDIESCPLKPEPNPNLNLTLTITLTSCREGFLRGFFLWHQFKEPLLQHLLITATNYSYISNHSYPFRILWYMIFIFRTSCFYIFLVTTKR